MAKSRKFEGVKGGEEFATRRLREDLRSIPEQLRDWWLTPDGQSNTFMILLIIGGVLIWVPLGGELVLILLAIFSKTLLGYKKKKWYFPFRVPIVADLIDDSTNRKGAGLIFLGNEVDNSLPAFISDNDARTHALMFGTTGSGKTEALLAFVVNSLIYGGGASYTDGKGDVKLWLKFLTACRMLGREDDLLLISFITSGQEFYDRQESKISNTMNMYSMGSSGMCTEASISLMDSSKGGDDMWKGRAIAFLGGLIMPMVFLRDKGELLLSADLIREYFELPILERFVWDQEDTWKGGIKRETGHFEKTYGKVWDRVIRPLRAFMVTIPGYDKAKLGTQEQKTVEQHGYITMQLARLFGTLADKYGHIMQAPLGEVEMYDVVINDRILVTLLPALENSPESLGMLGKIIVGGIKQMAAGCLGNKVEGLRREIVDARPTNSPTPFPTIFDEYGYYAVLGFAAMPAQARSLGFSVIFAAQDFASLKKSSPEEADQTWENTNLRGIGRITSGTDSETYKRMAALGGMVKVARRSGYERVIGLFRTRLRPSEDVRIEEEPRVNADDLHSQADGEFHLFMGMKESEQSEGRMRVVRVNSFYTDVEGIPGKPDKRIQKPIQYLSINHFASIPPPAVILDPRADTGLYGKTGAIEAIKSNKFATTVNANATQSPRIKLMALTGRHNASLPVEEQFSPLDLVFSSLVLADLRQMRQSDMQMMHLTRNPPALGVKPADVVQGDRASSSSSGSSDGPRLAPPSEAVAAKTKTDEAKADQAATATSGLVAKPSPIPEVRPGAQEAVATKAVALVQDKATEGQLQLTDQDKEALAKISLFTGGEISIPINTATEADILALAKDLLEAGDAVFGTGVGAEEAVEKAMDNGFVQATIQGIDKGIIVDSIVSANPVPLSPENSAKARAEGRDFVNKMALGSTYLEIPVPRESYGVSTFMEAVEALQSAVQGRDA